MTRNRSRGIKTATVLLRPIAALLVLSGCLSRSDPDAPPTLGATTLVVPSAGLPAGLRDNTSNNKWLLWKR